MAEAHGGVGLLTSWWPGSKKKEISFKDMPPDLTSFLLAPILKVPMSLDSKNGLGPYLQHMSFGSMGHPSPNHSTIFL
jgi:hypothetical protein